jgi:two-component system sensor histidine kinase KdpD
VAATLLAYARKHNVTRIIIGKPTHSRLRDRLGGSLVDTVIRGSGDIDVHVISGMPSERTAAVQRSRPRERAALRHYAWSALVVAVTLAVALMLRNVASLPDLEMLFLLAVIVNAIAFGRGPSILAAALGVTTSSSCRRSTRSTSRIGDTS